MNYKEQGYRDRCAGETLEAGRKHFPTGSPAFAAYGAGWRDADDDCEDRPDLAPGPQDEKVPLHLAISKQQKQQLLVASRKWGGSMAAYVRNRVFGEIADAAQ